MSHYFAANFIPAHDPTESRRSVERFFFFCAYGKHDEWIALVVASGQVCMISSETSQVVGPTDLDPSSAADCCAYVHPELRVDALTSQAGGNEHSLITVT